MRNKPEWLGELNWALIEEAVVDDANQSWEAATWLEECTPELCYALVTMRDALEEVACGVDPHDATEVAREALDACDVTSDD